MVWVTVTWMKRTLRIITCTAPSSSLQGGPCSAVQENPFTLERQGSSARAEVWDRCAQVNYGHSGTKGLVKFLNALIAWRERTRSVHGFMANNKPSVAKHALINMNNTKCWGIFDGFLVLVLVKNPYFPVLFRRHCDFLVQFRWSVGAVGKQHATDSLLLHLAMGPSASCQWKTLLICMLS